MAQSLTFAEAYYLQLEAVKQRLSNTATQKLITKPEELAQAMAKILNRIETNATSTVKGVKTILNRVSAPLAPQVTEWTDQYNLDILHYSIIYKRCDMVIFLLSNTSYFPPTHLPFTNPYAHLAAYLGHEDCLGAIVRHRPSDYFKISKPNHVIKIPWEVMKKASVFDMSRLGGIKMTDQSSHKMRASTKYTEKSTRGSQVKTTARLKMESDTVENMRTRKSRPRAVKGTNGFSSVSSKASKKGVRQSKVHVTSRSESRSISRQVSDSKIILQDEVEQQLTAKQETEQMGKSDKLHPYLRRKLVPSGDQHRITVYFDVLSNIAPGVLKGAGKPVDVKFAEKALLRPTRMTLDLPPITFAPSTKVTKRQKLKLHGRAGTSGSKYMPDIKQTAQRTEPSGGQTPAKHQQEIHSASDLKVKKAPPVAQKVEFGIRGYKKYKDDQIQILLPQAYQSDTNIKSKYWGKTPLTLAAERGHIGCVRFLLLNVISEKFPTLTKDELLTLATKSRCPEAIKLILKNERLHQDYQNAVLLAIREMYPECLSALLSSMTKYRILLFNGTNLYHMLYSQSIAAQCRHEMLPEMTRTLISLGENVNARNVPRTYPLYTLINCAFNIIKESEMSHYIKCLEILLAAKADPHFNEIIQERSYRRALSFTRGAFTSAINCILISAKLSAHFLENINLSKLIMERLITTIEIYDRTSRRIMNTILFDYMASVCVLGLDRSILRSLLRYGGNPDFKLDGKFAVNAYFDEMFPHTAKFEMATSFSVYEKEIQTLMIMCRYMSYDCLKEAALVFLNVHLLISPVQALPICRYFGYCINKLLWSPRPLLELAALTIWARLERNAKRAKLLPMSDKMKSLIIP